jgi:ubiquinone/menaquinone biosynthesis C-methylase UbiE
MRLILAFCCLALLTVAAAQNTHPVTGRQIAPVMGVGGADWLDREERASEEHPDVAIAHLDLKPGMIVADIGAGTGFYALRIAPRILPGGIVYAEDIQPGMLKLLSGNASARNIRNVTPVLGSDSDPKLPPGKIDLAVLVDVYHEFSHPQQMLRHIRGSLAPDGRLVLLEFRKEDPSVPVRPEHEMTVAQVKAEVVPEGFTFQKLDESLPRQHMIFFRKSHQ